MTEDTRATLSGSRWTTSRCRDDTSVGRVRLRALLIIFTAVAVLIVGFALAIATGWLRLGHVDPFARAASTTQPAPLAEPNDASLLPNPPSPDPAPAEAVKLPVVPPDRAIVLR